MTSSSQECLSKSGLIISGVFLKDMEVTETHNAIMKQLGVTMRWVPGRYAKPTTYRLRVPYRSRVGHSGC
jgi:hypothetical protein